MLCLDAVARKIEFMESDIHLAGAMFESLRAKPGMLERMGKSFRWLVLEPVGSSPDASIEINAGDGDPNAYNLIVNLSSGEPGKPAYPNLAERGVTTPQGWQLMADVGWVLGWRLPFENELDRIGGFGFSVVRALAGAPDDGRWRATLVKRGPRPGFTNPKLT